MPKVKIETLPGVFEEKEVTFEERREILLASELEQRYIDRDGTVIITRPYNALEDPDLVAFMEWKP